MNFVLQSMEPGAIGLIVQVVRIPVVEVPDTASECAIAPIQASVAIGVLVTKRIFWNATHRIAQVH